MIDPRPPPPLAAAVLLAMSMALATAASAGDRDAPTPPIASPAKGADAAALPPVATGDERVAFGSNEASGVEPPKDCEMSAEVTVAVTAAEAACLDRPIAQRELLGCVGTRCQAAAERNRLLSLIDMKPGTRLRPGQLATARCRLLATGFFRVPKVFCRLVSGRAHIALKVQGNSFVRYIQFRGNDKIYTDELESKLSFQQGDVLNHTTARGKARLAAQAKALRNVYVRQGYESAKVNVSAKRVGVGRLGVTIEVHEGEQRRVSTYEYLVRGRQRPTALDRQAGLICEPVSESDVRQTAALDDEDVYTRRAGRKARRAVRHWLRTKGYSNPRIELRHHRRDRRVTLDVRLGRCSVVRIYQRETGSGERGFRITEDRALNEALPFAESGVFDADEAERGRQALRAALENRGYLFADVRMELRQVPHSSRSQVDAAITYWITSGYQAQVRGLDFSGAKAFDQGELRGEISTRPYDLFDIGGYLQTEALFADLEQLRLFYRDNGYFEFGYRLIARSSVMGHGGVQRRSRREGNAEVFEFLRHTSGFRVRRPIGEHFIYVEVPLEEGRRTKLRSLEVKGANQVPQPKVRKLLGMTTGDVVSFNLLLDGLRTVEGYYRGLGFFNATFDIKCRPKGVSAAALVGETRSDSVPKVSVRGALNPNIRKRSSDVGGWGRCSAKRMLAEQVDVRMHIYEGKRVRMGEVFVSGNFNTEADVITRDLPEAGQDFSSQKLFEAQRRLRNLGLFRSVTFSYIGLDEKPVRDHVGLVIRVVEKPSVWLNLDAGFQTINVEQTTSFSPALIDLLEHTTSGQQRLTAGYGQRVGVELPSLLLVGDLSLRNENFLGAGKHMSGFGRVGWIPNFEAPQLLQAAMEYLDRRLVGSDVTLRLMLPYFSHDEATMTIDVQKFGAAAEVSKRFGRLYVATGLDVGGVAFKDKGDTTFKGTSEDGGFLDEFGLQIKVIPRLSYDSLDSGLNPTRGFFSSASLAWINALLFDNSGNPLGQHNFLKLEGTAKYFFTIARRVTFGAILHGGWGLKLDQSAGAQLPETERFRLGGQLGLRGYDDGGIARYDSDGQAYGKTVDVDSTEQKLGLPFACAVDVNESAEEKCTLYAADTSGDVVLNGSIESRFPMVRKWNLFGALFWDWGGIASNWSQLRAASIRHGVGLGLRLLISEQIPIRLDWGFSIGDRCLEPVAANAGVDAVQRACVKEDLGKLNAGLMYSF